jgi:hypothetical protein
MDYFNNASASTHTIPAPRSPTSNTGRMSPPPNNGRMSPGPNSGRMTPTNPFATPYNSATPYSSGTPKASRAQSLLNASTTAFQHQQNTEQPYFRSRRIQKDDKIEKPWLKKKDPKEKWVTIMSVFSYPKLSSPTVTLSYA